MNQMEVHAHFPANLCLYFHSPFTPAPWRAQIHTKKQFFQRNTDRTTKWIMQIDVCAHFLFFQPTLSLSPSPLTSVPFNSCTMRSLNPKQTKKHFFHTNTDRTTKWTMQRWKYVHIFSAFYPTCVFTSVPLSHLCKQTCSYTYTPPSVCGPTFSYILMRRLQL